MVHSIINNYSQFFSLSSFEGIFTVSGISTILLLVLLEGLLSADNALVLAMMVKHLPEKQQKKALMYGIWGAYIFRFLVIGIGTYLIKFTWIKAIGALYLLYMAYKGLFGESEEDLDISKVVKKGLWATVASVELMDIVFSIDSVTAALALSDKMWVLFLGAIFGILMMRGVAQVFVVLIEKVPELEKTAYILIALIGLKLGVTLVGIEVPDLLFFSVLIIIFLGTFVVSKFNKKEKVQPHN
ncbi:TerC family protein [Clostridium saccharobutylicum]|uniref:Inner membrane protein alx n=1 Tax=Clostridium saccharobutylicum TaxID=169679 RepID=A0A1S8NI63_CLOSA|nr:TerC family protein [Clostridium saccharobutylicum]OOM16130.1 inner membrane protein alx [Clostridium saccharobutylicum]